jgi:hypothetical protein
VPFLAVDRMVLGWVCHVFPKARSARAIVRPDTRTAQRSNDRSAQLSFQ